MITSGVDELPDCVKAEALVQVAHFSDFTADNDPHGEHDFGSFTLVGRKFFWKIEYYDKAGRLLKVLTPRRYVNVLGAAQRADEMEMHDVQAGSRTIMSVERRTLNSDLKENFFTEVELTRGSW